jgi:uncharacterized damage-inducible protein DinB
MKAGLVREKYDPYRRLLRRLEIQAQDLERLLYGIAEESLARRADPEKWSLKELLAHLWIIQRLFARRAERILREEVPAIEPYDPEEDPDFPKIAARPAARILGEFVQDRAALLARLGALAPADWQRRGEHPEFAHYTLHFLIEYMLHHEAHHLYQIFRLRSALGAISPGPPELLV